LTLVIKYVHSKRYRQKFKYYRGSFGEEASFKDVAAVAVKQYSSKELEMRYAHKAISGHLDRVMISRVVAKNVERFYRGPYHVDGDWESQQLRASGSLSVDWFAAKEAAEKQPYGTETPTTLASSSDVDTDDEFDQYRKNQAGLTTRLAADATAAMKQPSPALRPEKPAASQGSPYLMPAATGQQDIPANNFNLAPVTSFHSPVIRPRQDTVQTNNEWFMDSYEGYDILAGAEPFPEAQAQHRGNIDGGGGRGGGRGRGGGSGGSRQNV